MVYTHLQKLTQHFYILSIMCSNAGINTFTTAARIASNLTIGAKGAVQNASTQNLLLDAFLGLKRESTVEYINKTIEELVRQIQYKSEEERGMWIADIWRIWVHKRHPRTGEKEKALGRHMFLALYNHFPDTCIALVKARIFADIAYWKDCLLIWSTIMKMDGMDTRQKFVKYNPLIEAFRDSIMTQRTEDLKALDTFVSPRRIRDMSKEELITLLKVPGAKLPKLSWIGKYCVRETSSENNNLCWWIQDPSNGRLLRQSHVSFMLRASLKRRVAPGQYQPWGINEGVPFGAKKSWRVLNAKLDEALGVPEVKASLNRLDEIDPSKLPGEFTKRNIKFLLNEQVKKAPNDNEEDTGNRRPDDQSRVNLRKRTRDMFTDPDKMNVATLFPHEIAYSARVAQSIAHIDYHNAAFDKKVLDMMAEFDKIRKEMAATAMASSDTDHEIASAVGAAMATGRILGVADVSASMECGNAPHRPIDVATGMVSFISRVAAEPYRGLAMTFTNIPTIFDLKLGDRPMTVRESLQTLHLHVGYNTNYQKMHEALIKLCVDNSVPESELPVLYIASDCDFDKMDDNISVATRWDYNTRRYITQHQSITSVDRWNTTHMSITEMWTRAGYKKVPLMVYHNINTNQNGVQTTSDFKGVILLSGRSEQVLKFVLYGENSEEVETEVVVDGVVTKVKVNSVTPYDTFRKAMEAEHFELLERVLIESTEGMMKYVTQDNIGGYTGRAS